MVEQEEVRIYISNRVWHCWRTLPLLRRTGCDFDVFGASDDSEGGTRLEHHMEGEDRR